MNKDLPARVQPASSQALPVNCEVLPPGQPIAQPDVFVDASRLDQYSSVCVQMRETRIIASKEPAVINFAAPPALPPAHALPGKAMPAARPQFSIAQAAAWICALQLGVIIWILTGGPLHVDLGLNNLRNSLSWAAAPAINGLTHNGLFEVVPEPPAHSAVAAKPSNKKQKHKGKHQKVAAAKSSLGWPSAPTFVPPPPPDIPASGLTVPPPPVAFSLWQKGAGAVAASTLPEPPHAHPHAAAKDEPAKNEVVAAVKATPKGESQTKAEETKTHPAAAQAASQSAAQTQTAAQTQPSAQTPASKQTLATANVQPEMTAPLPVALPSVPLAAPLPGPQPLSSQAATGKRCYAVMTGARKRIITER